MFARFLEDNRLVDPPKLAGPGGRLDRARGEHTMFFQDRQRATQTDREYLLNVFGELARLPGAKEVFGGHSPVWELPNWLSGDAAGELLRFFQRIDAETGALAHDFTDPEWETRFLGDLYQDLSEAARKKYALLQTPEFVEEFILDRTLELALDEFGLDDFKMIDPACGSGHSLLGAFRRILERWQKQEPGAGVRDLVQRTLHSVHGVDLNLFAVAIARFRLLMTALKACGITRLGDAPVFELNLACGDSVYHGREQQRMLEGVETHESHYFRSEDAPSLRRMLREGAYHCVVANPPYIISNDQAANSVYRRLYTACYRQYSLAVPFMQRILALAVSSGYTGQITTNSFMTAAFGIRLIEDVLARADIQLVLDTSKAHIPGHGTGTVILTIRARAPLSPTVRAVLGKRGEPVIPAIPEQGRVWTSIEELIDHPDSESEYISVTDIPREVLAGRPWVLSGGGAAEPQRHLKSQSARDVSHLVADAGFLQDTHADEAFVFTFPFVRRKAAVEWFRPHGRGEDVRNWLIASDDAVLFPYTKDLHPWPSLPERGQWSWFWSLRIYLWGRTDFSGSSYRQAGRQWYEFHQMPRHRVAAEGPPVFAATATHNHFTLSRVQTIFNRSAPIVVASEAMCDTKSGDCLRL